MKKASVFNKVLSVVLAVCLIMSLAVPGLAAQSDVSFKKVSNSSVSADFSDRETVDLSEDEVAHADTDIVRVSIVLDKAGTLEAGYNAATVGTNFFSKLYRSNLKSNQDKVTAKIEKAIDAKLDVVWNLTLATNAISAYVAYGDIEAIEAVAGVKEVLIQTPYEPDVASAGAADPNMATSGKQIGSAPAWAAGITGAGSRIAIIDTGTDTDHQSFNATAFEFSLAYNAGKAGMTVAEYKEALNLLTAEEIDKVASQLNAPVTGADAYINSKLPFGYNYVDGNFNVTHDKDSQGSHGSHVAGIATANAYIPTADGGFVSALDSALVQGVAPDAQLITMKVFGANGGAYPDDYMAAIEDAIVLGCDSVNLSLGSGNPGTSKNSEAKFQEILDSLADCGVVVAMSAGNSGHWAEASYPGLLYADDVSMHTGGSPGSFTNSLGVASVNNDGKTGLYITVDGMMVVYNEMLEGNSGKYSNLPFTTLAGEQEYIFIDGLGTPEDWAAVGDALKGKIALCSRGELAFSEKATFAVEAGAIGTFIYDNQPGIINMDLSDYPYTAPCASLTQVDGAAIKAASTPVTDDAGNVLYYTGKLTISETMGAGQFNSPYYTMSSFSSWGVPQSLMMKPEITAPGGNIYSINGVDKSGTAYEVMSGTSMASPQVAGMAALMGQYIREAGLEEATGLTARQLAQSLLMSTAVPMLANASSYHSVLQQGAGLANVGAAIAADTYILMNADATVSYADGKVKAELGDDPDKTGKYAFSFTINNLEDVEKLYNLSADFFIQAPTNDGFDMYMHTSTVLIGALTTFTVNGEEVGAIWGMDGMDFNGDGEVNVLDGQALLDYATGVRTALTNEDKADIDADGDIDSYDAYLFLSAAEAVTTVPANGSVEVKVDIEIPAEWMSTIDYYYPNGTFLQGYVYAEGVSSDEGVAGTSHSIPVLGFYGNWSDASMFDKGTYNDYYAGTEDRLPYLTEENFANGIYNGLVINYPGDPDSYWFGGNPMVADDTYMPERDAISAVSGSVISKVKFTAIRNAADSYFVVKDAEGFWVAGNAGAVDSAYYYVNGGVWRNTAYTLDANFVPTGIPEGSVIDVGMMLVPEYYVADDGSFDPDALGDGAYMTVPMTVDNTAPVLESVNLNNNLMGGTYTLDIDVTDNQYIAAVALFDIYGQYLYTYKGSVDQAAGETVSYSLDLSKVNGPSFLLQVYDYAMNTTTYEIKTQIGEVVDYVDSITISDKTLMMAKGSEKTLTAIVNPVNTKNRDVIWSTSDESVVTVKNGVVEAVGAGSATVTATAAADETIFANCQITVVELNTTLKGVLQDAEGTPMLFTWDLQNDKTWTAGSVIATEMNSLALDKYTGNLYGHALSDMNMYLIDEATGELTKKSAAGAVYGAPMNDMAVSNLFGSATDPLMFGVFGSFFLGMTTPAENSFAQGWNLAAYLNAYTGASKFVAVTDHGVIEKSKNKYADVFLALDNSGTLWQLTFDGTGSLGLGFIPTDLNLSYPTSGDSQFCSLICDDKTGDMYLSYFTGATNEIYYLTYDAAFRGYKSLYVGNVGEDVWPAALYMATPNAAGEAEEVETNAIDTILDAFQTVDTTVEAAAVSVADLAKTPVTIQPMSGMSVITPNEERVTVIVDAGPKTDSSVKYTNGVFTITWDPEALELDSYDARADYTSVNLGEGTMTVGYVKMDGFYADYPVAYLYFKALNTDDATVTVTYTELDNEHVDVTEEVPVIYPHANTEVKDAKPATCTEEGYTGDTYCTVCGDKIAEGEVIPATGHTFENYVSDGNATCTEDGTKTAKCECCDETDTVADEGSAKGHNYESVVTKPTVDAEGFTTHTCTECGDSYVDSYTDKVDPENPKTVETFRNILAASLLVMSAAAVAGVYLASRKQKKF